MQAIRSRAPTWVKRLVWNRKHESRQIDPHAAPLVDFLTARISPRASLLDLGCGQGNLLAGLRLSGWKGEYTGVDISPKAISVARTANDPNAEWVVSPIERFAIQKTYDIICLIESIYYVELKSLRPLLVGCREHCETLYVRIWDSETHATYIRELGDCQHPAPDIFVIKGLAKLRTTP